jgi:hypothetical protein
MQKTAQLSASFAGNLSRRFWFWFLAIQFSVATVVIVFTACVNYSLLSIVRTLYVAITIGTAVLTTVASFVLLWRLQLDSTGVTKLLHALVTGVIIGTALFCLTSQSFSFFSLTLKAGLLFEYLSPVCCSVVTVFASLVDIERRGGFNLLLPTDSPKVADNLRNLLSQNVLSWSSTSLFVGIFVVLVRQMTKSFYIRILACMEPGNVCSYDSQQQTSLTVTSICGPSIISFFLRSFIEIGHCLLVTALTHPLDFSKLDLMARSSNLISGGEDTFLSEALAIGGTKLGEKNFFWLQPYPHRSSMISSSSGVSNSSSGSSSSSSAGSRSSSSSVIKALSFSKDRSTLTLALSSQGDLSKKPTTTSNSNSYSNSYSNSSSNSNSILDILGGWRKGASPWSEASELQKVFKQELLKSVTPRLDGPPLLPYFCTQNRGLSQLRGVLCRSLGFQDLRRITASKDKVKNLFKAKGKWPEIVFSCCGIVDAAAIQVNGLYSFLSLYYI